MTRKLYTGLGVLLVLLIGASLVLLKHTTETEQKIIYRDVEPSKESIDTFSHQTMKNNPPAAERGYKWVWHHNHWDKVPISEQSEPPILANDTPTHKTVQVESIVIDGVGDLKEYLDFFESFGDDPPLEQHEKYLAKSIEYGESMRGFNYDTASAEVKKLIRRIENMRTSLGYIFGSKSDANRINTTDSKFIDSSVILGPTSDEGGDQ